MVNKKKLLKNFTVLIIAGSDPSGGAGFQGDIATITALGGRSMAVPSALTVQGPSGVQQVAPLPAKQIAAAIRALRKNFVIDAVKIGMLHDLATVTAVRRALKDLSAPIVLDPVWRPSRGRSLATRGLLDAIVAELWSLLHVVTPNIPEAQELCGWPLQDLEQRIAAAQALQDLGTHAVLVKGGHDDGEQAIDVLASEDKVDLLHSPRLHSNRTHGTGCALSSAIAAGLAQGFTTLRACQAAKRALDAALRIDHQLGRGGRSVAHAAMTQAFYAPASPRD